MLSLTEVSTLGATHLFWEILIGSVFLGGRLLSMFKILGFEDGAETFLASADDLVFLIEFAFFLGFS